jgi:hypothetical protein
VAELEARHMAIPPVPFCSEHVARDFWAKGNPWCHGSHLQAEYRSHGLALPPITVPVGA